MAFLFHQNMRNFGGGVTALGRNAAYHAAFTASALAAGGGVAVGGFTEVTNNVAAANQFSGAVGGVNLCGALGLAHVANIACGRTALAHGPEYIAIGVANIANVVAVGRFFFNVVQGRMHLIHDVSPAVPPGAAWANGVSEYASADYRGIVYVVYDLPTGGGGVNRIAVGFLHNLYTFLAQRVLVMGQLPYMLARMGSTLGPGFLPVAKYVGGDFNVGVISPRGTSRIGFCYAYTAGMVAAPAIPGLPLAYPAFTPGGTLWSGNLYDYWFSNHPPGGPGVPAPPAPLLQPPVPAGDSRTLNAPTGVAGSMSDHSAVYLRIQ